MLLQAVLRRITQEARPKAAHAACPNWNRVGVDGTYSSDEKAGKVRGLRAVFRTPAGDAHPENCGDSITSRVTVFKRIDNTMYAGRKIRQVVPRSWSIASLSLRLFAETKLTTRGAIKPSFTPTRSTARTNGSPGCGLPFRCTGSAAAHRAVNIPALQR